MTGSAGMLLTLLLGAALLFAGNGAKECSMNCKDTCDDCKRLTPSECRRFPSWWGSCDLSCGKCTPCDLSDFISTIEELNSRYSDHVADINDKLDELFVNNVNHEEPYPLNIVQVSPSSAGQYSVHNVVDGELGTDLSAGQCFESGTSDGDSLFLGIEHVAVVTHIRLLARGDCCAESLVGASVAVCDRLNTCATCGVVEQTGLGEWAEVPCHIDGTGVRITAADGQSLQLCEVRVFGAYHYGKYCERYTLGCGQSANRQFVGTAETMAECVRMVQSADVSANGATMENPDGARTPYACYAERGQNGTNGDEAFVNCKIALKDQKSFKAVGCKEDEFKCTSGITDPLFESYISRLDRGVGADCIPAYWRCDGTMDCRGGEDEEGCFFETTTPEMIIPPTDPCLELIPSDEIDYCPGNWRLIYQYVKQLEGGWTYETMEDVSNPADSSDGWVFLNSFYVRNGERPGFVRGPPNDEIYVCKDIGECPGFELFARCEDGEGRMMAVPGTTCPGRYSLLSTFFSKPGSFEFNVLRKLPNPDSGELELPKDLCSIQFENNLPFLACPDYLTSVSMTQFSTYLTEDGTVSNLYRPMFFFGRDSPAPGFVEIEALQSKGGEYMREHFYRSDLGLNGLQSLEFIDKFWVCVDINACPGFEKMTVCDSEDEDTLVVGSFSNVDSCPENSYPIYTFYSQIDSKHYMEMNLGSECVEFSFGPVNSDRELVGEVSYMYQCIEMVQEAYPSANGASIQVVPYSPGKAQCFKETLGDSIEVEGYEDAEVMTCRIIPVKQVDGSVPCAELSPEDEMKHCPENWSLRYQYVKQLENGWVYQTLDDVPNPEETLDGWVFLNSFYTRAGERPGFERAGPVDDFYVCFDVEECPGFELFARCEDGNGRMMAMPGSSCPGRYNIVSQFFSKQASFEFDVLKEVQNPDSGELELPEDICPIEIENQLPIRNCPDYFTSQLLEQFYVKQGFFGPSEMYRMMFFFGRDSPASGFTELQLYQDHSPRGSIHAYQIGQSFSTEDLELLGKFWVCVDINACPGFVKMWVCDSENRGSVIVRSEEDSGKLVKCPYDSYPISTFYSLTDLKAFMEYSLGGGDLCREFGLGVANPDREHVGEVYLMSECIELVQDADPLANGASLGVQSKTDGRRLPCYKEKLGESIVQPASYEHAEVMTCRIEPVKVGGGQLKLVTSHTITSSNMMRGACVDKATGKRPESYFELSPTFDYDAYFDNDDLGPRLEFLQECLDECLNHPGAYGCEVRVVDLIDHCYALEEPVDAADGRGGGLNCWVFTREEETQNELPKISGQLKVVQSETITSTDLLQGACLEAPDATSYIIDEVMDNSKALPKAEFLTECLNSCLMFPQSTGCEVQDLDGVDHCFAHTGAVDGADGRPGFGCWIFNRVEVKESEIPE